MKVYVLTIDDVYDFERFGRAPRVFTDKWKALNALYEEYKWGKKMLKDNGNNDWIEDDYKKGDSCFSMYPDGYWGTSHYDGKVNEVEIES